jgi:hypothetical protein
MEVAVLVPSGEESPDGPQDPCIPVEYWLVTRRGGELLRTRPLVTPCNDGYGAAGMGEDSVDVGPGLLVHTRSGGSAWRWSTSTALALDPLTVVEEGSDGYWTLGRNAERIAWNWTTFSGEATWYSPPCGPDGEPVWLDGGEVEPVSAEESHAYLPIPSFDALPAEYSAGGWRGTSPGGCAALVDGTAGAGYVLEGDSNPQDASFRVLLEGTSVLYVEIVDDDLRAEGRAPDELRLAVGETSASYMDHCLPAAGGGIAAPYRIRPTDGRVTGPGTPPAVERAAANGGVRLRIDLGRPVQAFAIAYADGDGGRRHERVIATARWEERDANSLGRALAIPPNRAGCSIGVGRLEAVPFRDFPIDEPVLE